MYIFIYIHIYIYIYIYTHTGTYIYIYVNKTPQNPEKKTAPNIQLALNEMSGAALTPSLWQRLPSTWFQLGKSCHWGEKYGKSTIYRLYIDIYRYL